MAVEALFKEIKNSLSAYNEDEYYNRYVREQSERYVTRVHYTNSWTSQSIYNNFLNLFKKEEIPLTGRQIAELKRIVERVTKNCNTKGNWERALNPHFIIATASDVRRGDVNNKVFIRPHHGIEVRYYKNYTAGQESGMLWADKSYTAQKEIMNLIADKCIPEIRDSKEFGTKEHSAAFGLGEGTRFGVRAHAGDLRGGGRNDETGYRSDTTVRLINFLEDMGKKDFDSALSADELTGYSPRDLGYIAERINTDFNAGYSIEGFSNINMFKDNVAEKEISIKIVFGDQQKNALAAAADKGNFSSGGKGLDGFFARLEDKLMREFARNPGKKASLSIQEMAKRGVFANVASNLKTSSGMPDMRFKINKQLVKDAKYKEREKKRKGLSLSKKKTTRLKSKKGKVKKTRALKADRGQNITQNPLALESLLNELLPKVVASKMTSPALNYRTGRFAESVEATEVMVGPKGGLNINYTYQKDPYQTFEPGFARGSTYRDPRKIIGESVREIAQSIMKDKFIRVRRV